MNSSSWLFGAGAVPSHADVFEARQAARLGRQLRGADPPGTPVQSVRALLMQGLCCDANKSNVVYLACLYSISVRLYVYSKVYAVESHVQGTKTELYYIAFVQTERLISWRPST